MIAALAPLHVVVINDASVARGGATSLALSSIRSMREQGIRVTLLCGDGGSNDDLEARGVEIIALGQRPVLSSGLAAAVSRGLYNKSSKDVLRAWIKQHDTTDTVYHIHTWTKILSSSIFSALDQVIKRVFISAHDFFLVCPNGAYAFFSTGDTCTLRPLSRACISSRCDRRHHAHKLWRVARQFVQTRLLRYDADLPRVLVVHDGMTPPLLRGGVPPAAITLLPNPIEAWTQDRITAERNQEFLFVGRLDAEKGVDLLARAARRAGVPLCIIGDGPMLDSLRREFPEVRFAGRCTSAEIAPFARAARALVMPSRYPEPFGLVAGEALWSGLPVIATANCLLTSSIVTAGAGLACHPRDEDAFAGILSQVAADDDAVRAMSVAAFTGTGHLGTQPREWIRRLLDLYRRACDAERSSDTTPPIDPPFPPRPTAHATIMGPIDSAVVHHLPVNDMAS